MFFGIIFIVAGKCTIKKSMMMKSYSTWGPSFRVSFILKFKKLPSNKWTSIIHVTNGGNYGKYGDRIPAVFCRRWRSYIQVIFCSAVSRSMNFCPSIRATVGKQYDITIQQSKKGGIYWYQILIPGKRTKRYRNWRPRKFTNVKLYTSDPWYQALTSDLGTVSNLKIENQ